MSKERIKCVRKAIWHPIWLAVDDSIVLSSVDSVLAFVWTSIWRPIIREYL